MSSIRELRDRVASARDGRTLRLLLVDIFSELRRTAPSEVGSSFDEKMEILLRGFFARDVRQAIADILKNLAIGYSPVKDDVEDLADLVKSDLYGPSIRSHVTQAIDLMTGGFVRITKSGSNVTYSSDVSYVLVGEALIMNVTPNTGYIWADENPIIVNHGSSSVTPVKSGDQYTISILEVQHDISITTNVIPDQPMCEVVITGIGLTNATYSDNREYVPREEPYTQTITIASGYHAPFGLSVLMGTEAQPVTHPENNTWGCSIDSVTDKISIYIEIYPESSRKATMEFLAGINVAKTRTPVVDFETKPLSENEIKYIKIEHTSDHQSAGTPEDYDCKSMEIEYDDINHTWKHRSYVGVDGKSYTLTGSGMSVTFGENVGITVQVKPGVIEDGDGNTYYAGFNVRSYFNMTISDTIPS